MSYRKFSLRLIVGFFLTNYFPDFCSAAFTETNPSARIVGQILSAEDDLPLAHVNVYIEALGRGDVSDRDGKFEIDRLPPGDFLLVFRLQGYEVRDGEFVSLLANQAVELNVKLRSKIIELDQMVVTATRTADKSWSVPQLVTVVTPRNLRERNAAQTPELLREEAGISVQKTNQGGGSPIIRGFKANKVLLLIDGIRLNNSTYRGGNTQYLNTLDSGALERIEVVHGPQSVAYGSDALGGTVNSVTRSPSLNEANFRLANWGVSTRLASAENSIISRANLELANRRVGFLANGSFKSFGDVQRGSSGGAELMRRLQNDPRVDRVLNKTQSPNGYDSYDLHLKTLLKLSDESDLAAVYQLSRQKDVPRYDVIEAGKDSVRLFDPQERDLLYLKYSDLKGNRAYDRLTATFSIHRQLEQRRRIKTGGSRETSDRFRTWTNGLQLQLDKTLNNRHRIQYGADFYFDDVATSSRSRDLVTDESERVSPLFPDGSTFRTLGFYAQDAITPGTRWQFIAGARLNFSRLSAPFVDDPASDDIFGNIKQSSTSLTGSFGGSYSVSETLNLVANFAQGFRTPNLDDVSKLGPGKGSSFFDVPNPEAGAEKTLSIDAGLKIHAPSLRVDAIGFYTRVSDLLLRRPASFRGLSFIVDGSDTLAVFHKENAGRAYTAGFTLNSEIALTDGIAVFLGGSYTYGQNLSDDEPLSAIPPFSGNAGARLRAGRYRAALSVRFAAAQSRLAALDRADLRIPEGGTPAWATINFRSSIHFSRLVSGHAAVTNILDTNYREHLSGLNAPGRSFIVGAELNY